MWALKALLLIGLLYTAVLAAVFFAQTSLIFPASMVEGNGPLTAGAERLAVDTPDGARLHGVHVQGTGRGAGELPVILGFPGNAWNAESAALYLSDLYAGADVVVFHYRGYKPSGGKPSARALMADASLVHDFVARRFADRPVVAVGFSIGSGVAAHLASRKVLAGVILVTPFDSLAAVASGHYPWLPIRLLLRHRMNPAEDMRHSLVPAALIVAGRDTLIPPARAEALAGSIGNGVFKHIVAGAGHNDIYQSGEFRSVMAEALARVSDRN